jgi:hypothetical protein
MKEGNAPSFISPLSCQLLTYSWSASYARMATSVWPDLTLARRCEVPTYMTTLLVTVRTTS